MSEIPDFQKLNLLWQTCAAFIAEHKPICAESCHDNDRIHENATSLIEGICEIVGYFEYEDGA